MTAAIFTGADVVTAARAWIDTPFRHQGRAKGKGVDCAGLVIGVARDLGMEAEDVAGYSRQPFGDSLKRVIDAQMVRVSAAEPGDVYLMRFDSDPQHLAIASDIGIIHAYSSARRCVEHSLDDVWRKRIVAIYRFRELS